MRVADEDRQLTVKELEHLILIKNREALRWDTEPCAMPLKDISESRLKSFLKSAGLKWGTVSGALEKLELLKEGRLLNTASIFFSKTPNLQLRCAVFGGTSSATIIDRHDLKETILR